MLYASIVVFFCDNVYIVKYSLWIVCISEPLMLLVDDCALEVTVL